jgi:hypothetical protein
MTRYLCFAIVLLLAASMQGCCPAKYRLMGTWEMVSPTVAVPDTSGGGHEGRGGAIKVLNKTHFAFGIWTPDGHVFAGGGRYKYDGGKYTEIIEYHFIPTLVGKSLEFHCILKGDKWYHFGTYEVDGQRSEMNEVWRRVE